MKYRDYKFFRPNCYFHIFNRGVNKENIFREEIDYINFLKRLKLSLGLAQSSALHINDLPQGSFSILSYCLMPNHFHFLIRQNTETGLDGLLSKLATSYSMYFNKKYERIGPLFQDTFKAKLIDSDSYLTYVSAYIHNNPTSPLGYAYSSLPDILGVRNGTLVDKKTLLGLFNNSTDAYKNFVVGFKQQDKKIISHLLFEDEKEKG